MAVSKVYTKRGDGGRTQLASGEKVAKSDPRIEAYGSVDELNSILGLLIVELNEIPSPNPLIAAKEALQRIQIDLFNLGAELAMSKLPNPLPNWLIHKDAIDELEQEIDTFSVSLEPLRNFILPGGSKGAAISHMARTVCRRAERHAVALVESSIEIRPDVIIYLNRLSDWLFTFARTINHRLNIPETLWQPRAR